MKKLNSEVLAPIFSTPTGATSENQGVALVFDTQIDTIIETKPKLHDYGGDVSRRWYIEYYEDGKRKREWIAARPVKTKPDRAKKELQKKLSLYKGDNYNYTTLDQALLLMEIKPKTLQTYRTDINLLKKVFPDFNDIDPKEFKNYLTISKYHKNTVRNKITNVKVVFNFAFDEKLISVNPFAGFKNLSRSKDSDYYNPFSDYERSLIEPELLKNTQLYLFTRFIYYSFSRIKELQLLRVKDIDLRTRTIRFLPENVKTERLIIKPIVKPLLDLILESGILNNPSNAFVFGYNLKPGFKPCQKNLPTSLHRDILKSLNLYRNHETTIYGWKHTGNINAYLKGMDIKLIQKINGHSSLEITEVYLRKLGLFLDKQAFDFEF